MTPSDHLRLYRLQGISFALEPGQALDDLKQADVFGECYRESSWRSRGTLSKFLEQELTRITVKEWGLLEAAPYVATSKTRTGDDEVFIGIPEFDGPIFELNTLGAEPCEYGVLQYTTRAAQIILSIHQVLFQYNGIRLYETKVAGPACPPFRFKRFFPNVHFAPWHEKESVLRLNREWSGPNVALIATTTPVPWEVPVWLGAPDRSVLVHGSYARLERGRLDWRLSPDQERAHNLIYNLKEKTWR